MKKISIKIPYSEIKINLNSPPYLKKNMLEPKTHPFYSSILYKYILLYNNM